MMRIRSMAEMPVRRVEMLEHRPEPHLEGLARLLQERARGQARLVVAVAALERRAVADRPHVRRAARAHAGLPPQRASIQYARQSSSVANRRSNSVAV